MDRGVRELFEGVYLLQGNVGERPLDLIYLKGETASLLFDTGCAGDPQRFIVPQIREAGGDPSQLKWIINSHSDFDHTGGNHEMKQLAPGAILASGDADMAACTSPENIVRLRYDAYHQKHGITYGEEGIQGILTQAGAHQPIEMTFTGGERIRLGDDWTVEVLHVPGHSHGHLALYDRKHAALYAGDAVHGAVYYGFDGEPKLCPTYLHVDAYLNTIRFVEHLPIETYSGCHWPVMTGDEIRQFCAASRDFVVRADALLRDFLQEPHTLREACLELGPKLGAWPREIDIELAYALNGHLEALKMRGLVAETPNDDGIMQYQMAGAAKS